MEGLSSPCIPMCVQSLGAAAWWVGVLVPLGHPSLLFSSGTQPGGWRGEAQDKNQGGTHMVAGNVWSPASRHRDRCQTGVGRGQAMLQFPSQGPLGVTYPSQQHTSCLTHSDRRHRWFSPMEAMVSCFLEALIFVSQGPTQKKSNRSQ